MLVINGETIILMDVKDMFNGNLNLNGTNVDVFNKNTINRHYNLEIVEGLQQQINNINSEINDFRNTIKHLNSRNESFNTTFKGFLEVIDTINDTNKDIKNEDNNELNKNLENDNINDEEKIKKENKEKGKKTEDTMKKIIVDAFNDVFQRKKE